MPFIQSDTLIYTACAGRQSQWLNILICMRLRVVFTMSGQWWAVSLLIIDRNETNYSFNRENDSDKWMPDSLLFHHIQCPMMRVNISSAFSTLYAFSTLFHAQTLALFSCFIQNIWALFSSVLHFGLSSVPQTPNLWPPFLSSRRDIYFALIIIISWKIPSSSCLPVSHYPPFLRTENPLTFHTKQNTRCILAHFSRSHWLEVADISVFRQRSLMDFLFGAVRLLSSSSAYTIRFTVIPLICMLLLPTHNNWI